MRGTRNPAAIPLRAALMAAGLFTLACEGSAPPARGFGSRQLVSISDPNLMLHGFATKVGSSTGSDGRTYYHSTVDLDVVWYRTGDGAETPVEHWALDLRDGALQSLGPSLPSVTIPPPQPPPGSLRCAIRSANGAATLVITDPATDAETAIESIIFYVRCPTENDRQLVAIRRDEAGRGRLWAGPYDALQMVPLGISIGRIVLPDFRGDRLVVVAAPDDAPGDWRIDAIALSSLTTSTLVEAALAPGAAWATGAPASDQPLRSDRLLPDAVNFLGDWGFTYPREMPDGTGVMFAGPFPGGAAPELALFPIRGFASPILFGLVTDSGVSDGQVPYDAWLDVGQAIGEVHALHVWDVERSRLTSCPVPAGLNMALYGRVLPWANAVVFGGLSSDESTGPLVLYLRDQEGPQACRVLADGGVSQVAWSTEVLAWRESLGPEEAALRTVRFDGSEPRLIGTGWLQYPHFVSPLELQFFFGSDLVAVDLRDDPVELDYLAEGVFGSFINWGVSIITGYGYNTQDGTGNLGVVNRETGERRLISTAVDEFLFGYRPAEGVVDVVYQVRGRNASDQDGIWIATIPYDELD